MSHADTLKTSLALPCGTAIPNRFGKSAMSEALGTIDNHVTPALETLYGRWSDGGTGLLITGNIMIDRNHTGEPNNVVLESEQDLPLLKRWAEAGKRNGIWTGLCGEMAGDPTAIPLLIGLGIDELSVAPPMLPQIKYLIRRIKLSEAQQLAAQALKCESSVDILVQSRRNRLAALRFFRKLLKGQGCVPRRLITDKIYCDRVMPHSVVPGE